MTLYIFVADWNIRLLRAVVVIYGLKETLLQSNDETSIMAQEIEWIKTSLREIKDEIFESKDKAIMARSTESKFMGLLNRLHDQMRQLNDIFEKPMGVTVQVGPSASIIENLSLECSPMSNVNTALEEWPHINDVFGVIELQDCLLELEQDLWITECGIKNLKIMAADRFVPELPAFEVKLQQIIIQIHGLRVQLADMKNSEHSPHNKETKKRIMQDIQRFNSEIKDMKILSNRALMEATGSPD